MTLPPLASRRIELVLMAGVVLADQASKAAVRARLAIHESITIVPDLLDFTHVRNTGAAFGFLNTVDVPFKPVLIAAIATLALAGIAFYALQVPREDTLARSALGLILGGAVGNLVDRATLGYVVDFVDAYWGAYHFWAFNVADAAITVGASLLILGALRARSHVSTTV